MRNDVGLNEFADKFETDISTLAQTWGVTQDDPRIVDIRQSANIILDRTDNDLRRMSLGNAPYDEDLQKHYKSLTDQNYTPRIVGNTLQANTEERSQAHKLLKSLAYVIGVTVHANKAPLTAEYAPDQPARTPTNGLSEADYFKDTIPNRHSESPAIAVRSNVGVAHAATDDGFDWDQRSIPQPTTIDELADLRNEAKDISEIIRKATSADELKNYIQNKLKVRLKEVKQDLNTRRKDFDTEATYQLMNADLIDFAPSLELLMLQGLRRIRTQSPKALDAPKQAPQDFDTRLAKLQSNIDASLEITTGAKLKVALDNRLKPKATELKGEIETLKNSGADATAIDQKERHLAVIISAISKTLRKMNAEIDAETKASKLPVLTEVIEEKDLPFPLLPLEEIGSKMASAELWTPPEYNEFKFGEAEHKHVPFELKLPDAATAEAVTGLPSLLSDEEIDHSIQAVPAKETTAPPTQSANVKKLLALGSPQTLTTGDAAVIADTSFIDRPHPEALPKPETPTFDFTQRVKPKPSFFQEHFKRAAAVFAGIAIAATMAFSGGKAPDTESVKKVSTPEPTAQAVKQQVAQQPTVAVAMAPVNDFASVPVVTVATPEPTVEVAPIAPAARVKAPTIVKHFVAKAESKAVEPMASVQDTEPAVERTISSADELKSDAVTIQGVYAFLKEKDKIVPNGVFASLNPS